MTRRVSQEALIARSEIVAPPAERACEDHNFGLPPAIHLAMGALFLGFVGVLCLALANPGGTFRHLRSHHPRLLCGARDLRESIAGEGI